MLRPVLLRREGTDLSSADAATELAALARRLGLRGAFGPAYRFAKQQQQRFDAGRMDIGRRALAFAGREGRPAVLVVGETHVLHEPFLDCDIAELAAANGAVAVPLDCYPVSASVPRLRRMHWASAGALLRACAQAMGADVFPVLVCAYGCGPNSVVEYLFNDLLGDYPHAVLESDGHGGNAGYVTRMQAFLHSVRSYRAAAAEHSDGAAGLPPAAAPDVLLALYDEPEPRRLAGDGYRRVLFGTVGGCWAARSRPACAARACRRPMWAHRATMPLSCRMMPARARSACLTSSSGAHWPALCTPRRSRSPRPEGGEVATAHGREGRRRPRQDPLLERRPGFRACRAHCFPSRSRSRWHRRGTTTWTWPTYPSSTTTSVSCRPSGAAWSPWICST